MLKHTKRLSQLEKVITDAMSVDPIEVFSSENNTDALISRVIFIKDSFVEFHRLITKTLSTVEMPDDKRAFLNEALTCMESLVMASVGQGFAGAMLVDESKRVAKVMEQNDAYRASQFRVALDAFALTLLTCYSGVRDGVREPDSSLLELLYRKAMPLIYKGNEVATTIDRLKWAHSERRDNSEGSGYIEHRPSSRVVLDALMKGLNYSESEDLLEKFEKDLDFYEKTFGELASIKDEEPMDTDQI